MRRVVVTGLGAITPLGLNVPDTWNGILAGQSGVTRVEAFDVSAFPTQILANVKGFHVEDYLNSKDARKMDVFTQYGMVAAHEALRDAGLLELSDAEQLRAGVAVGAGIGGLLTITNNQDRLVQGGPKKVSPFFIPAGIINMVAGQISIHHHLKGPNISVVTACTTGTHNIGLAARLIRYGDADVMICGGTEMTATPLGLAGFCSVRALSRRNDEPEKASRPFDKDRDGFVMGEGAGIVVLESYEHAIARNARIYGELVGFGMSADAFHMTAPDEHGDGAARCMQAALNDAKLTPNAIQYINAHGTSTYLNDLNETKAIKKVFAQHAYAVRVSSTKSMIGHLLGAAGAVEAIFSLLAIRDQIAPPTINLDCPEAGLDLNFVPKIAQKCEITHVMSTSLAFGGTNGALIFKKITA